MRLKILLIAALAFLAAGCQTSVNIRTATPPAAVSAGTLLTVMAYNIRMGAGSQRDRRNIYYLNWGANLDGVIAEIRRADPDLIALQEVAGVSQAKALGAALNMNYAYVGHETARAEGSWWGVAVLSKFPIVSSRGVEISFGRGDQRTMLVAAVDIGGRPLTFLSVHKDKDLKDGSSIVNMMQEVENLPGPVLIAGDMNITPTESNGRLEMITARFQDTSAAVQTPGAREMRNAGTFFFSGRHIDYVYSDPRFFTVEDVGLVETAKPASDHFAYVAKLRWK